MRQISLVINQSCLRVQIILELYSTYITNKTIHYNRNENKISVVSRLINVFQLEKVKIRIRMKEPRCTCWAPQWRPPLASPWSAGGTPAQHAKPGTVNQFIFIKKGVWHEIFYFRFFLWISFPRAPTDPIGSISNFYENSRRSSTVKVPAINKLRISPRIRIGPNENSGAGTSLNLSLTDPCFPRHGNKDPTKDSKDPSLMSKDKLPNNV